jgi:hypothetical protein
MARLHFSYGGLQIPEQAGDLLKPASSAMKITQTGAPGHGSSVARDVI